MSGAEEAIRRNIITIKEFTQGTRDMVVQLQKELTVVKGQYLEQQKQIEMYKNQIVNLQKKLYK